MNAHVLLNLLKLVEKKRSNVMLCRAFYHLFVTSLINQVIQEHKY